MSEIKKEAGKGHKWRKGTNFSKYRDNYDLIFRSYKSPTKQKCLKIKEKKDLK